VAPLNTVAVFLEGRGGLALLDDPLLGPATAEIVAGGGLQGAAAWHDERGNPGFMPIEGESQGQQR
jgi:hypothetical protein